jgi:hypothetical protein
MVWSDPEGSGRWLSAYCPLLTSRILGAAGRRARRRSVRQRRTHHKIDDTRKAASRTRNVGKPKGGAADGARRVVLDADRSAADRTRDGARLGLDERGRDDLDGPLGRAAGFECGEAHPVAHDLGVTATLGPALSTGPSRRAHDEHRKRGAKDVQVRATPLQEESSTRTPPLARRRRVRSGEVCTPVGLP